MLKVKLEVLPRVHRSPDVNILLYQPFFKTNLKRSPRAAFFCTYYITSVPKEKKIAPYCQTVNILVNYRGIFYIINF